MSVPTFISERRSIRAYSDRPVPREMLDSLVEAACLAPAPHHSRPWRFAVVETSAAKQALAEAMGDRWRIDLAADGVEPERIERRVATSCRRIERAPAALLACLTVDGLEPYPDAPRSQAEWSMALLSLGAAVENLLLAASATGLAACWLAAPMFCPEVARDSLDLPAEWHPQAMVLVGFADPTSPKPAEREDVRLDSVRVTR